MDELPGVHRTHEVCVAVTTREAGLRSAAFLLSCTRSRVRHLIGILIALEKYLRPVCGGESLLPGCSRVAHARGALVTTGQLIQEMNNLLERSFHEIGGDLPTNFLQSNMECVDQLVDQYHFFLRCLCARKNFVIGFKNTCRIRTKELLAAITLVIRRPENMPAALCTLDGFVSRPGILSFNHCRRTVCFIVPEGVLPEWDFARRPRQSGAAAL
jgi:hypothetical protein